MKFECCAEDFSDALQKVSRALINKKDTKILEGIKIKAENNNKVTFFATDMELTIIKTIKADVFIEGELIIPGKEITNFAKTLNNNIILESKDEKTLKISYSGSEVVFNCLNKEDYPEEIEYTTNYEIDIPAKKLKNLIRKTMFSVSTIEEQIIFRGCYFEKEKDKLTFVGVDGKRIAVAYENIENTTGDFSGIIPLKTADEILKLLEDNIIVNFKCSNKKLVLKIKNTIIKSSLIQGEYIKYKELMKLENNIEIIVEKKLLKESIERISLVMNTKQEKSNSLKIEINEEEMKLITSSNVVVKVIERVPIYLNGKDITIAINLKYLESCLNVIDEDIITIKMYNSIKPIFVEGKNNEKFKYMFIPISIINA